MNWQFWKLSETVLFFLQTFEEKTHWLHFQPPYFEVYRLHTKPTPNLELRLELINTSYVKHS